MAAVYGDSVLMQYADQLTVPANHAGNPGISLPAGIDASGLPIGIQLLGADFNESTLFRIGRAFEQATEKESWRQVRLRAAGFITLNFENFDEEKIFLAILTMVLIIP
jgi:aspartyl-tRNA(Asn)/glutamyl-tRNA(Gln) amidotransferase subunit A